MKMGRLISFEGPDGAGKSSVLQALVPELERAGYEVVTTREPGGVAIAEQIRQVILHPEHTAMDDKTELLLYIAARRQHLMEKVLPALEAGKLVLVDRFIDSSVAYQGFGRGLNQEAIDWLNAFATDGLKPDVTLYFDLDVKLGLERIAQHRTGDMDRMDRETIDLHERVRQGYLSILATESERIIKIDASQPFEQVVAASLAVLQERLARLGVGER